MSPALHLPLPPWPLMPLFASARRLGALLSPLAALVLRWVVLALLLAVPALPLVALV